MEPAITPFEQIDKDLFYNCIDCPSLIEIQKLSEKNNSIKFICINTNEEKTIDIEEYLENMQKYKNNNYIQDKCDKHEYEQYRYYCMDCKCNLCDKCMKVKIHKKHKKEIIYDLQPDDEDLKIIEDRIEEYDNKIKNLKDEMMNNINAQINAILKNIDDEDDSKKVSRDIKHLKKSTDFKNIIEEIDSYTNEIHEEFDEIKYLIKFADNTHKLIDRHKNVMTNIFRGAGLRPSKRIEEEEKLKNEKGKIKKFKSAGKFVVDNIGSYNEDENEYDDQPYYKNGYYYRNAKEDDMNFGEVFDKLKAINKVKDNLSNIQDDFLGYHQNLRTKMRRINGGK